MSFQQLYAVILVELIIFQSKEPFMYECSWKSLFQAISKDGVFQWKHITKEKKWILDLFVCLVYF